MDCNACKDLLPEYALGVLEGAEREELLAHLQTGCPICQGRLAEAHAILAMLPLSLDAVPAPASARRRLLEKLKFTPAGRNEALQISGKAGASPQRGIRWLAPATLGGALAASITVLIFMNILIQERKSVDKLKFDVVQKERELADLRTSAQDGRDLRRLVESPIVQVVTLHGLAAQPGARGRLIWSPINKSFHFFGSDLQNLPPGRAYELWLINDKSKAIPAGVCTVDAHGGIEIANALKADPGVIMQTAVTDEPSAGVQQPTGTMQLLGKVN